MDRMIQLAVGNCGGAFPGARNGLVKLEFAISALVSCRALAWVENRLLRLSDKSRRCLAMHGAIYGCKAGLEWKKHSEDFTNAIYAGMWEYWKSEERKHPYCENITGCNTAGNVVEALMGVAWLHLHGDLVSVDEFRTSLLSHDLDAYEVVAGDVFSFLKEHEHQSVGPVSWITFVEEAVIGYKEVWKACPWIQCSKSGYVADLQLCHVEALRLGHVSGFPFHMRNRWPPTRLGIQSWEDKIEIEKEMQQIKVQWRMMN
jgi:hypothetical protein